MNVCISLKCLSYNKKVVFLIISCLSLLWSCSEADEPIDNKKLYLSSFSFLKDNNPGLSEDIVYYPSSYDTTLYFFIPKFEGLDSLVATFDGVFTKVLSNGTEQLSNVTPNDYNQPIIFELYDKKNIKGNEYKVYVKGYNGIPIIRIDTEEGKTIDSKTEYVNAQFSISNASDLMGKIDIAGKIRGRGNWTWKTYPKKPYKIKFDDKINLLLGGDNKDYVLLAEYCDRSFLRTAYMATISSKLEMPYTIKYQHVEVLLNGEYQGLYLLTDQIEKAKDRISIKEDGFIIEDDRYYKEEPLWFTSEKYDVNYTFKYPKASNGNITLNDDNYNFIKDFIDKIEMSIDSKTAYTFIDYDSFAKWYICNELLWNMDTNIYYVLPSKGEKLQMYPVWDAEWSLGLSVLNKAGNNWEKDPSLIRTDTTQWNDKLYFMMLLKDKEFVNRVKKIWSEKKNAMNEINSEMMQIAEELEYAQTDNFKKWPIMGKKISVELFVANSFQEEIVFISDFFRRKLIWFDSYINSL